MKYKIKENEWKQELPLTAEQKQMLINNSLNAEKKDKQGKEIQPIKVEREFVKAVKKDDDKLKAIWEKHKHKEVNAKVIDTLITLEEGKKERGIINYRTEKGEHKQIRF